MPANFHGYPSTSYTQPEYIDPFKRTWEPYKPSGIGNPYKYTEYKPTHVGIYGEKQREKRIITPPRTPIRKPTQTVVKKPREPVVRYQYYRKPIGPDIKLQDTGPDIKLRKTGPDYKIPPYKPSEFKTSQPRVFDNAFKEDPLRHRAQYMAKYEPSELSKPHSYKLTKDNYPPMRFWRSGGVNETVSSGPQDVSRKTQPIKKETQYPKTLKDSSTQSVAIATKNAPTQTHVANKSAMTQTTPLPPINVVPVPTVAKETKRKQNTIGTQYSPPPRSPEFIHPLAPQEFQQATPISERTPTPIQTMSEPVRQPSRSPSPLVPVFAPVVASKPPVSQAETTGEQLQAFSTVPKQSRLPPEISAHIEAYNSVHVPGEARTSIQRTMRFI